MYAYTWFKSVSRLVDYMNDMEIDQSRIINITINEEMIYLVYLR